MKNWTFSGWQWKLSKTEFSMSTIMLLLGNVFRGMGGERGGMPEMAAPLPAPGAPTGGDMGQSGTTQLQSVERTRSLFPETWLWLDDRTGYDYTAKKQHHQQQQCIYTIYICHHIPSAQYITA